MVKVPALAGATQFVEKPVEKLESVALTTCIQTLPEDVEVHVTVIPLARVTVVLFAGPVIVGSLASVKFAVKAPISAPPVPLTVKLPGMRNVPAELMVAFHLVPGTKIGKLSDYLTSKGVTCRENGHS
jgi:hypothetical protein